MSSKTPFEIRFELLVLAKDILNQKTGAEHERLTNDWFAQREIASQEKLPMPSYPILPVIDSQDIINLAKELNNFVSNG